MMKNVRLVVATAVFMTAFAVVLLVNACHKEELPEKVFAATPYVLQIPRYFPTQLNIPDDNPLTQEGVRLGRYLFYDTRLCGYMGNDPDSMLSCASCHVQAHNFDVGMDNPRFPGGHPYGLSGLATVHTPLPLMNLVFNAEGYFWNGLISESNPNVGRRWVEDIVVMAIAAPDEMNATENESLTALAAAGFYGKMFEQAFGTPEITMERVQKALAQFVRVLVSGNSKFDRYLRGEEQLSDAELRGYVLFTTEEGADCFHCHGSEGSPLFTTNLFYNNALDATFDNAHDRYSVTGNPMDKGAYRAPSLRNVAVSAPYMHDGRFQTLDEVLQFYNAGLVNSPYVHPLMHKINDGGACLTPSQLADLKSFLLTLTDEEFLTKEEFSNPF